MALLTSTWSDGNRGVSPLLGRRRVSPDGQTIALLYSDTFGPVTHILTKNLRSPVEKSTNVETFTALCEKGEWNKKNFETILAVRKVCFHKKKKNSQRSPTPCERFNAFIVECQGADQKRTCGIRR